MAQVKWTMLHPKMTMEHLGLLPFWLDDANPKGACDQLDDGYTFGGFKQYPFEGFKSSSDAKLPETVRHMCLKYPGDPLMRPLATATLREETICFYDAAIVAVWQKDGTFKAARFD